MDFPKIIEELEYKKKKLDIAKQLDSEHQRKLDEKFRLELNFNSNHIEGNTLTYGETRLLLLRGKVTGDHEKQEIDEMQAHDVAFDMIKEWAKEKRDITESELRQLNKIILVRPFWKEAITQDDQPTRKQIIPGEYKSTPNSVRQKDGQMHHYASVSETPALMEELMNWYVKKEEKHPVIRAARAHHRFTQIHPFDDGNGRVARLWMNYILLKEGYPLLVIKSKNKTKYLNALAKADAGDFPAFVEFIGNELMWSIDLSLKASRGESVEEDDDLDKKIALLDKQLNRKDTELPKSKIAIQHIWNNGIMTLFQQFINKSEPFSKLFKSSHLKISVVGIRDFPSLDALDRWINSSEDMDRATEILFRYDFINLKTASGNYPLQLSVRLNEAEYQILPPKGPVRKFYGTLLSDYELSEIIKELTNDHYKRIERDIINYSKSK